MALARQHRSIRRRPARTGRRARALGLTTAGALPLLAYTRRLGSTTPRADVPEPAFRVLALASSETTAWSTAPRRMSRPDAEKREAARSVLAC